MTTSNRTAATASDVGLTVSAERDHDRISECTCRLDKP
jgi:hypothetical protein